MSDKEDGKAWPLQDHGHATTPAVAGVSTPTITSNTNRQLRLDVLRFPLIVGVVFIHAYGTNVGVADGVIGIAQPSPISDFVRNFISQGVARVAVPLLFLISGYLFFAGDSQPGRTYWTKLRSRISTLLVPLIFWNVLSLAMFAVAQTLTMTHPYFSGRNMSVSDFSVSDYVCAIFGIGRQPIAHQFWFIRDLIILAVLTPLISALAKAVPTLLLTVLAGCWLVDSWPEYAPTIDATLFFSAGCLLAIRRADLFALDKHGMPIAITYLALILADAALMQTHPNIYAHKLTILVGMAATLYLTRFAERVPRIRDWLLDLSKASFFVFAAHEPLLTIVRKLAYKFTDARSDWVVLLLYFLIPALLIALLVWVYRTWLPALPRPIMRVVNGGR